jgi:hypothetical protein
VVRVEFWEPAGTFDVPGKGEFPQRYASHAFDGAIGKTVPLKHEGGVPVGTATLVEVRVDADGLGATFVVDIDDL